MKEALLTRIRRRTNRFLKNRAGQSTTEYILILAIVVMIASKLKKSMDTTVSNTVQGLDSKMQGFMNEN